MNDDAQEVREEIAEAKVAEARLGAGVNFSKVWVVPIVALLIGLWMVYSHYAGQGPIGLVLQVKVDGPVWSFFGQTGRQVLQNGGLADAALSKEQDGVILWAAQHT